METNSLLVGHVFAGGLVGHIVRSEHGGVVGGCVGAMRVSKTERRQVGGCAGHVHEPAARRFVGGCVGTILLRASSSQPAEPATKQPQRETRIAWGEEALA